MGIPEENESAATDPAQPSEHEIAQIKKRFPERDLSLVELKAGEHSFAFVLTGPNRIEWKRYVDELRKASGNVADATAAIERAAMAQIRWPDRDTVTAMFEKYPALGSNFAEAMSKLAVVEAEVTIKKL
jgi:hypothetical protein